jgi:queuosine precursor transporter
LWHSAQYFQFEKHKNYIYIVVMEHSEQHANFRYYDLIMAAFVTVLLVSNIASSAKILDWGVSIFGLRLAFDAGTILFPLSYIFGDVLTEVYGYKRGRRVIWMGFFCSGLMSLVLWLVGRMPAELGWQQTVGMERYNLILGGVSSGAIMLASLTAYFAGEFSNSFILAKMKIATKGRWLWTRTIGSTLIGEGLDTVIFVSIATLLKVPGFTSSIWLSLVVANYIFKTAIEIFMTPATYGIINFLKRAESIDYYDIKTNFNPFRISTDI